MSGVSLAIIKLVLIAFFGFVLYKRQVIDDRVSRFLTSFVVNFTIPSLVFSHLIKNSALVRQRSLWKYLLMSLLIFGLGLLFSFLLRGAKAGAYRKEVAGLLSFQNCGYLPMNIVFFIFSGQRREEFLVYIFLYLLGFNLLMWSLGSFLIFKKDEKSFKIMTLFNPPVLGTLAALALIYLGFPGAIPPLILEPVSMVGDLSFVLSMIILGCWLARISQRDFVKQLPLLIEVGIFKLLVIPFVVACLLIFFQQTSALAFFMLLEAAMPSAASLPIVANMYKADNNFVSQGVFLTHIFSIFTIPIWFSLWEIAGFSLLGA